MTADAAKIKKINSDDSRCCWGYRERGTLLHFWWDCILVQPLWKSFWWFLRKLEVIVPEDPVIPLLGIYLRKAPTYYKDTKDTCTTMFIAALFIIARSWKEPRCRSVDEWILKLWYIYTMEYYSATRNNDFMKYLRKWMLLGNIILSEVTQSQKNRHNMRSLW